MASERRKLDTLRGNAIENRGCLLASERSERDTLRGNAIEISLYLFASERSERDTYRGKNEKTGDVCIYVTVYGKIGHNAACVDVAKRSI